MAFKKEENNIFFIVLAITVAVIPLVATQNIDCNGKAFHCVNSTHFKICVDLGGGISTTVDDFVIPCPRSTVCKDSNYFECEYVATTTLKPTVKSEVPNDLSVTPSLKNVDLATVFNYNTSENKLSEIVVSTTPSSTLKFSEITTDSAIQVSTSDFSDSDKYNLQNTTLSEASTTNDGLKSTTITKVTLDNIEHNDKIKTNINLFKKTNSTDNDETPTSIFADSSSKYNAVTEKNYGNPNNEQLATTIFNNTKHLDVFTNTFPDSTTVIAQVSYNTNYVTNETTTENIITTSNNKLLNLNITSNNTNNLIEVENMLIVSDLNNVTKDEQSHLKYSKPGSSKDMNYNTTVEESGVKIAEVTVDLSYTNVRDNVSTTGVYTIEANKNFSMLFSKAVKLDKYTATDRNTIYDTTTVPILPTSGIDNLTDFTTTSKYNPKEASEIDTTVDPSQNMNKSTLNVVKPFENTLPTDNLLSTSNASNVIWSTFVTTDVENTTDLMMFDNVNNNQNKTFTNVTLDTNSSLKLDDKPKTEFVSVRSNTYAVEPLPKHEEISSQPYLLQRISSITTASIGEDFNETKSMTTDQLTTYENSYSTPTLYSDSKRNDFVDKTMQPKINDIFFFEINAYNDSFTRPMDINIDKNVENSTVESQLHSEMNMRDITTEIGTITVNNIYKETTRAIAENSLSTEKTNTVENYDNHLNIPGKRSTLTVRYFELRETSTINLSEFSYDNTIASLPMPLIDTTVQNKDSINNTANIEGIQTDNYRNMFNTESTKEIANFDASTVQSDTLRINSSTDTIIEIKNEIDNNQILNNLTVGDTNYPEPLINYTENTTVNTETLSTTTVIDDTIVSLSPFISTTVPDIVSQSNITNIEVEVKINETTNSDVITTQNMLVDVHSTTPHINFTENFDANNRIISTTTTNILNENSNNNHTDITITKVAENIKSPGISITTDNEVKLAIYKKENFNEKSTILSHNDTKSLSRNNLETERKTDLNKYILNKTRVTDTNETYNTTQDTYGARDSDNNQIKMPDGGFNYNHFIESHGENTITNKQSLSPTTEIVYVDVSNEFEISTKMMIDNGNISIMNSTGNPTLPNTYITEKNSEQIQPYTNNIKQQDTYSNGNNKGYIQTLSNSKIEPEVKFTKEFNKDTTVSTFSAASERDITEKNNNTSGNIMNDTNNNDSDRINMPPIDNSDAIGLKVATESMYNKNDETNNNDALTKILRDTDIGENKIYQQNSELNEQTFNTTVRSEHTSTYKNSTTVRTEDNAVDSIINGTKTLPIEIFNDTNTINVTSAPIYTENESKLSTVVKNNEDLNLNISTGNEKFTNIFYNMEVQELKASKNITKKNENVNDSNYFNKQIYSNNTFGDNITATNNIIRSTQNGINSKVQDMKLVRDLFKSDMNFIEELDKTSQMNQTAKEVELRDDKPVTSVYQSQKTNGSTIHTPNKNNKAVIDEIEWTTNTAYLTQNISKLTTNDNNHFESNQTANISTHDNTNLKSYENNIQHLQIHNSESNVKDKVTDNTNNMKDKTRIISTEIYNNITNSNINLLTDSASNKIINLNEDANSIDQIRINGTLATVTSPQLKLDFLDVDTKSDAVDIRKTQTNQMAKHNIELQNTSVTYIPTPNKSNLSDIKTGSKTYKSSSIEVSKHSNIKNTAAVLTLSPVSEEMKSGNASKAINDTTSFIDINATRVPLYSQGYLEHITDTNTTKPYNISKDSYISSSNNNVTVNPKKMLNTSVLSNRDNNNSITTKNDIDIATDDNETLKSTLKHNKPVQRNSSLSMLLNPYSLTSETQTISAARNIVNDMLLSNQTTSSSIKDNANLQNIPEILKYDFTTLPYEVKNKITQPTKDIGIKIEDDINIFQNKEHETQVTSSVIGPVSVTTYKHDVQQIPITEPAHTQTPFTCKIRNHGKYPDENDCKKFYICTGKHSPITGSCPAGTVFSDIRKQCTKNLSHCIRNNQFKCLAEGRFIDVLSIDYYYICAKNKKGFVRFKLKCQKDYYLNKHTVHCLPKEASFEDYSKNTSETRTRESTSSETVRNTNSFECEEEGKFEYPEDCRKYYVCSKKSSEFRRRIKQCDSDEVFDVDKKKCVDEETYECRF